MPQHPTGRPAAILALMLVAAAGCDRSAPDSPAPDSPEQKTPATTATAAVHPGKALIDRHCTRCHLAPDPADLSREYWPYAIHYMGNYVGMRGNEFPDFRTEDFPPELEPVRDYTKR